MWSPGRCWTCMCPCHPRSKASFPWPLSRRRPPTPAIFCFASPVWLLGVNYYWSHLCLQTAWWSLISLETSYQTWNWAGRVNRIPLVRFHCHLVGLYPQCAHLSIFATGQAAWLEWQDIWDSVNYYWRYWGRVSPEKGLQGIILIFTSLSAFSIWNWPSYRLS